MKKVKAPVRVSLEQEMNCAAFEQSVGGGFAIPSQHRASVGDVLSNMVHVAEMQGKYIAMREALSIATRGGRHG